MVKKLVNQSLLEYRMPASANGRRKYRLLALVESFSTGATTTTDAAEAEAGLCEALLASSLDEAFDECKLPSDDFASLERLLNDGDDDHDGPDDGTPVADPAAEDDAER